MRILVTLIVIALLCGSPVFGVEIFAGAKLGDNHLYGDTISEADVKGKVVFVEYWGINCPPCRASFPHLVQLQKDLFETEKFTVFASHVQGLSSEVITFLDEKKVNFPVYQQARLTNAPCASGIPSAHLFDHTGTLIKSGHPKEMYNLARKLVKDAPHPVLNGVEVKMCKGEAAILESGRNWGKAVNALQKKADKPDSPAAAEAKAILANIDAYLENKMAKAQKVLETSPTKGFTLLNELAKRAAGLDMGKAAAEEAKALQKNKYFQMLSKLSAMYDKLAAKKKLSHSENTLKSINKSLDQILAAEDAPANVKTEAAALQKLLKPYIF